MRHETFLGSSIGVLYRQIVSKYPNGVKFVSTQQIRNGDKIRYAISFKYIEIADEINTKFKNAFIEKIEGLEDKIAKLESLGDMEPANNACIDTIKEELRAKGVDAKWLEKISEVLVKNELDTEKNLIMHYILEELDASLVFSKKDKQPPKIIMMTGPTGVGKTTAIAKLVNYYKDKIDTSKMAFINLDHYRVAASEQLKGYANLMDVEYGDIEDASEFSRELDRFQDKELIFVDTGGISPFDINRLLETVSFIRGASAHDLSIVLVLCATLKKEDLIAMYEHFSFLNLDNLIVTKFDETSSISGLVDFLRSCQTPLYYFSIGQDIEKDLMPASSDYLLSRLAKEWQNIECEA
ncbi:MAG: GTP-binding protein [Sulfurovaceae bacterium]